MIKVTAIPAFNDNYIWQLQHVDRPNQVVVVDPGDAQPVLAQLNEQQTIVAVLITHHHHDHTGGIAAIKQAFPECIVYGPHSNKAIAIDIRLKHHDEITLPELKVKLKILEVPGHTLDHIAYYADQDLTAPLLFCGDTLFSAGCGRMFEGQPAQYWQSLNTLMALADSSLIYCTHEYTLANIAFAESIEPDNAELILYKEKVTYLRSINQPSLPSQLAQEKAINPFLRAGNKKVKQQVTQRLQQTKPLSDSQCFAELRRLKDHF